MIPVQGNSLQHRVSKRSIGNNLTSSGFWNALQQTTQVGNRSCGEAKNKVLSQAVSMLTICIRGGEKKTHLHLSPCISRTQGLNRRTFMKVITLPSLGRGLGDEKWEDRDTGRWFRDVSFFALLYILNFESDEYVALKKILLIDWLIWRERKRKSERENAFIGWFMHVPWPGVKATTLTYQEDSNELSYPAARATF